MQVKLTWQDPNTGEVKTPVLKAPIAIGRNFSRMPEEINSEKVVKIVIDDDLIADYHFLIDWQNSELVATNQYILSDINTSHGISNGNISGKKLQDGDRLNISACEITIHFLNSPILEESSSSESNSNPSKIQENIEQEFRCERMIGFLVKRRCDRTDRTGCEYCNDINDTITTYEYDYAYYENYGDYSSASWGENYYQERHKYSYDPKSGNVDFTEADAESFTTEKDSEFEVNFDAS
ncbi:MAG: FHA domain-containing protein [Cyanobacteria bacterium P01_A01_bin.45]